MATVHHTDLNAHFSTVNPASIAEEIGTGTTQCQNSKPAFVIVEEAERFVKGIINTEPSMEISGEHP